MKSMGASPSPLQFPAIVEREEEERRRKKKRKGRKRRKKGKTSPPIFSFLDPPLVVGASTFHENSDFSWAHKRYVLIWRLAVWSIVGVELPGVRACMHVPH